MLIAAVGVAAIAIAAVVREPRGASKSPAAKHDAHTTALQASGQPAGAAASSREAMPSREVERQDASSPTDADHSATPKTSARALSEEVNELFFAQDYCNVSSGGDEKRKQRCRRARGTDRECSQDLGRLLGLRHGLGARPSCDRAEPAGRRLGCGRAQGSALQRPRCVVYMEGPGRWGYSFARLISAINSDPLILQLNEQRRWPAPGAYDQRVNDRALLVLPRQ